METWVTKTLASYAVATGFRTYPREVVERVKTLILDNIGCMLGGCETSLGKAIIEPITGMGGNPEATVIGAGVRLPTIQAAFINGTTANALDYDDTLLGIGHPGSSVIPSALAMGEWRRASGRDVLNAILIGYDVGDRIGLGIQPTYERLQQVWGVGTWQTLGAAVAAAKVLGADLDQMLNTMGVAGATAPLPNTQKWGWHLEERPIHWVKEPTGWPAWTGTTAAVLAQNGFIGNRFILDGNNGFWVMAGSDKCDYDVMTRGLGQDFEVMQNIAIKPYSSCRWQHATLDCVRLLKQAYHLEIEEIDSVKVSSFAWVKTHELYQPADMVDAQFCIPYTVSMVLAGHPPGPAWYTPEMLGDERILEFSKRVTVETDPELDRAYFDHDQLAARVSIATRDGKEVSEFVEIPRGDPRNPLGRAEIEAKFRNQAAYHLRDTAIDRLIETIYDFENLADVNQLTALIG